MDQARHTAKTSAGAWEQAFNKLDATVPFHTLSRAAHGKSSRWPERENERFFRAALAGRRRTRGTNGHLGILEIALLLMFDSVRDSRIEFVGWLLTVSELARRVLIRGS